jgi:hypothetical protein
MRIARRGAGLSACSGSGRSQTDEVDMGHTWTCGGCPEPRSHSGRSVPSRAAGPVGADDAHEPGATAGDIIYNVSQFFTSPGDAWATEWPRWKARWVDTIEQAHGMYQSVESLGAGG